jgi:hypothetical protein
MDTAALNDIHAAFAQPISWQQDAAQVNAVAVVFNARGDDPIGDGMSVRQRGYEIQQNALPFEPRNGAIITDAGTQWRVIDVMEYDEARAWRVQVEIQ